MLKLSCATIKLKSVEFNSLIWFILNLFISDLVTIQYLHPCLLTALITGHLRDDLYKTIFRTLIPFVMSSNESSDTLFHDSQSFVQTDKNFWRACSRCKKMSIKVSLETSCDLLPKHFHIFFCYCIRFIGANRNSLTFLELAHFTPIFS